MSDIKTVKILTTKSGKFSFSAKYSYEQLVEPIVEARVLSNTINDLPPMLPKALSRINEELIRKSIFGTAAIEGNPLREEEVGKILAQDGSIDVSEDRYETEIRNLKEAYEWVDSLESTPDNQILTEERIKLLHKIITKDIEHEYNIPGNYRNNKVEVGDSDHGGIYTPPKTLHDVKMVMDEFFLWINGDDFIKADDKNMVIIRAVLIHYYICLIHPFSDGNGRVARLLEAMILHLSGVKYVPRMLSNYYYRNIDKYYLAFSKTEQSKENDVTEFLRFVLQGLVEASHEIQESITFFFRGLSLFSFYRSLERKRVITNRQYELVLLLMDRLKDFTIWDLYNTPPFTAIYRDVTVRTAQRDLKRLLEKKVLKCSNKKEYSLNLRVLD